MLYGCETWTAGKKMTKSFKATDVWSIARIVMKLDSLQEFQEISKKIVN